MTHTGGGIEVTDLCDEAAPAAASAPPPRLLIVATDASATQFRPFLFRSYDPPDGAGGDGLDDGLNLDDQVRSLSRERWMAVSSRGRIASSLF